MPRRVIWLGALAAALGVACSGTPEPTKGAAGTSEPGSGTTPPSQEARLRPATLSVLVAGDAVPEIALAGARHWQRGGAAGHRVLVVSFGSTRCAEDSPCAETQRKLRAAQDDLQKSPSLSASIGLLTLSVDPANDVPAALRAHADRIGADPELWRFATLPPNRVDEVLARFGATRDDPVTAIVDADGKLAKIYSSSDWTGQELARDVQSLILRAEPAVLSAYITSQEALASNDYPAAKRALGQLRTAVREPAVVRLASSAATASDLHGMRAAFKPLSEALVRLPWPAPYQAMYCPMFDANAGATWVQKAGPVTNPYFGKAMLHCGNDLSIGAHSDHSPKFGGVLFMATDAYHHVEGTYTPDGLLRIYVYDNFKRAIAVRGIRATAERSDQGERVRMRPSADGQTLEWRLGTSPFPAEITVKMLFGPGGDEERFDFVFAAYSPLKS